MILFVAGLFLGCGLGVFLIAMLVKSKEDDEAVYRLMKEKGKLAF